MSVKQFWLAGSNGSLSGEQACRNWNKQNIHNSMVWMSDESVYHLLPQDSHTCDEICLWGAMTWLTEIQAYSYQYA